MASTIKYIYNLATTANRSLENAITSTTNIPSNIQETLYHDKTSSIDQFIQNLQVLLEPDRKFPLGSPDQKNSLLWFTHQIRSLLKNSETLFCIDLSKEDQHAAPFKELNLCLKQTLSKLARGTTALQNDATLTIYDHSVTLDRRTQISSITIDSSTHQAAATAIGALKKLKLSSTGLLTTQKHLADSSIELTTFVSNLQQLQDAVISKNSETIKERFEALDVATILKHKNAIFYGKPFTEEDESLIKNFEAAFKDFQNLPEPLKADSRFRPNILELMNSIVSTSELVKSYLNIQKGLGTQLLDSLNNIAAKGKETLIAKGKETLAEITPNLLQNHPTATPQEKTYTPFDKLNAAIAFFKSTRTPYSKEEKKDIILDVLLACDETCKGFEKTFLDTIKEASPRSEKNNPNWAINHFFDSYPLLKKALQNALKFAVENPAPVAPQANPAPVAPQANPAPVAPQANPTPTPTTTEELLKALNPENPTQEIPKPPSNTIIDFVGSFLKMFPFLPSSTVGMCATSLESILNASYFTTFINTQSDETKVFLTSLRNTTCEALNKAKISKNLDDFKQAFTIFKELYNKHHLILDGFTLNPLLEESDGKQLEMLENQIIELHQQFAKNQVEKASDVNWSDETKVDAKIKNQRELLSENLQDKLTYELIYKTLTGSTDNTDTVFYRIKSVQKLKNSQAERSKVFKDELKIEINKSSMNIFSKMIVKCFLPFFHHLIGLYTKTFITNLFESINTTLDQIDKKDLITRASNCFSKYNAILNEWSTLPEGGDKHPVIKEFITKAKYLKYGEENYTQKQLYNQVSNNLIDRYFSVYGNSKGTIAPSSKLKKLMKKSNDFAMKKLLSSKNILASSLNYTFIGVKIITTTLPTYIILGPILPLLKTFESFINGLTKLLFKRTLNHFNVIDSLVVSARNGIYENNPYVHAITSFLADQLGKLSTQLDEAIVNPKKDIANSKVQPEVSVLTRSLLKSTFEHLMEILNKNQIGTQEKLKEFIENKGALELADEKLRQVLLPGIIESIIDVTVLASNSLNKKSLQKPISLLLDQLNEIITLAPDNSEKALKEKRLEQQAAELKLTKYTDKILKQLITKTVNDTISSLGESGPKFVEDMKVWLQATLNGEAGHITKWTTLLADFNNAEKTAEERFNTIQEFYNSLKGFIDEVTDKHDQIKQLPSRTYKTLDTQFAKIITPLFALSNEMSGVLALYKNQQLIYKTTEDRHYFSALEKAYDATNKSFATMKTDAWLAAPTKTITTIIEKNSQFLDTTLSDLKKKKITLLKDTDSYEEFFKLIDLEKQVERKNSIAAMHTSYLPTLNILKDLHTSVEDLKTKKDQYLRTHRFWHSNRREPFMLAHKAFLDKLKTIPVPQTRALLIEKLNVLYTANSPRAANAAYRALVQGLETSTAKQKSNIRISIEKITGIDNAIYKKAKNLREAYNADIEKYQTANNQITPNTQVLLQNISAQVDAWETISFMPMQTTLLDSLKTLPSSVIYRFLKPKAVGAVNLIRDGNFAQFFANHTLMMPFAKTK